MTAHRPQLQRLLGEMDRSPTLFALALIAAVSLSLYAAPGANSPRTVVLTASDSMEFNVTQIEAHPGDRLHVELRNAGTFQKEVMGHDWILLKAGADPTAYAAAALSAGNEGYQPPSLSDQVLASIALIGAGQTGEVTFDVPARPGRYPYLCSVPGHGQTGMRGELVVR